VTTYGYDAAQHLTSAVEPTSGTGTRTTQYKYYENGTLEDIIDANGNDTHWAIDIQSRPTSKTYQYGTASAKTETYACENTTSRLHSITDALGR
jgi:YD repeat-containing protein